MPKNQSQQFNKPFPLLRAEKTQTIVFSDSPLTIFGTLNKDGYNEELVRRCNEYDQLKAENGRLQKTIDGLLETGSSKLSIASDQKLKAENEALKVALTAARNFLSAIPNSVFNEYGQKDKMGLIESFDKLINK